ncbi:MAG: hypothetical protein AB1776_06460 [Bacillota bacterium]
MNLRACPALCRLTEELRGRLKDMARVVQEVNRALDGRAAETLSPLEKAGLLYYLQAFYAGVEDILLRIVAEVDRFSFPGQDLGRELLRRMTLEVPRVRPAVLDTGLFRRLEAYRTFTAEARRLRGIPAPAPVFALVVDLPDVYAAFAAQVEMFLDHLWRAGECGGQEE